MTTDYRIREDVRANGSSAWSVQQYRNEQWQTTCYVDDKKKATKHIKAMRGLVVVGTQYHSVPDRQNTDE